jgi:cytochrome P450 family 6
MILVSVKLLNANDILSIILGMGNVLLILVTTLFVSLVAVYLYVKRTFNYWKNKNVHQLTPTFPFGNFSSAFRQKTSLGSATEKLYADHNDKPFVGVYVSLRPSLLVNDPELVKNILIRDFQHFQDRGFYVNEKTDPLSGHLFALTGDKWKNLRAKLTPTFTTGKLKGMFQTLLDTGKKLQEHFENIADVGQTVEVRDILARYNTDIIASVAFGLDCDSLKNPNAKFREVGKKVRILSDCYLK